MDLKNSMKLEFDARKSNISFARVTVAAFMSQLDPTLEETQDIKTAISEAVTNAVVHGYDKTEGKILIEAELSDNAINVKVSDTGKGISNIREAMEPLFTTKESSEHSGMGFMFMQAFMDEVRVESTPMEGCSVYMKKKIGSEGV